MVEVERRRRSSRLDDMDLREAAAERHDALAVEDQRSENPELHGATKAQWRAVVIRPLLFLRIRFAQ